MASIVETAPLVLDVGVVLMAAATSGLVARRVGLPAIVGYLLVGLLVSPFTPGFVADKNQLALLADIGVVLLLFEVGIEIDLKRIRREHNALLWAVPSQLLIGLLIGTPLFLFMDIPILGALLLALSLAMSSSVVIVNITRSRRRTTHTETEEALLGWSVLQDLVGVAAAAIILTFFGDSEKSLVASLAGLIGFILFAIVCAKVLPRLLKLVRWEKDLFLIYSVAIGLTIAALGTVFFDIPMALASFVAGLSITQSRDTDEVRKAVLPFKDLFQVLFFVVVGSLVNPELVMKALPFAALLVAMMVSLKTVPTIVLSRLGKLKANHPQLAVGLSQIGEFSFVLGGAALAASAITDTQFTGILMAVIASIIISTLAVRPLGRRFIQ
ncbi:MAG: cation:proton antiporter [Candidatus Planktophila sp.]